MDKGKKTLILVIIALILAISAIAINLSASEKVSTEPSDLQANPGVGEVGISIIPYEGVEDKLAGDIEA